MLRWMRRAAAPLIAIISVVGLLGGGIAYAGSEFDPPPSGYPCQWNTAWDTTNYSAGIQTFGGSCYWTVAETCGTYPGPWTWYRSPLVLTPANSTGNSWVGPCPGSQIHSNFGICLSAGAFGWWFWDHNAQLWKLNNGTNNPCPT